MKKVFIVALFLMLFAVGALAEGAKVPDGIPMHDRTNLKNWGFFYVGGEYENSEADKGSVMRGQMYVEVYEPVEVTKPYPVVFLHGNYQTGLNWMGTVDGKDGWTDYFVNQGYIVYVCDMPTRGRASYPVDASLTYRNVTAERGLTSFAGTDNELQTQWPENLDMDSEVYRQFYATQNVSLASNIVMQELVLNAGTKLLDKIGEAIIVTHSQSGTYGWLLADARPSLVKAVVAMEPSGPNFSKNNTDYGVTGLPMTFEPAINGPEDIETETYTPAEGSGLREGKLQKEPARQLVNLKNIPMTIITSEASYHNTYDYLTAMFLVQAGADLEHINLPEKNIHGNGHMMMIEMNSLEIANLVDQWINEHVK